MAYSTTAKNTMLTALAGDITHVSLHSAFPATDANEIAATRQAITFGAASGGEIAATGAITFDDVPGGATVAAIGYRIDLSGATEPIADADVTDETFAGAGEYVLDTATLDLNA